MKQVTRDVLLPILDEYNRLGIAEQIDYEKFYLYSIITHSTAIEGSTVTEVEAQLLFDEGITSSKRTMQEQMMNLDLRDAYLYGSQWIARHEDITIESLITLAAKVMQHTGSEYHSVGGDFLAAKGELRKLNVTAGFGGRSYLSYMKVPEMLERFCTELNRRRKALDPTDILAVYELSFWAHFELVTIHPWADGNGRTSRLLMNLLQMEHHLLPSKVLKEDKAEYIESLVEAREKEDVNIFIDTMIKLHIQHLKADISAFETSVNVPKNVQKKLTERQQVILDLVRKDSSITLAEMSKRMRVSSKTIQRDIDSLRMQGLLTRVGGRSLGYWEVTEEK